MTTVIFGDAVVMYDRAAKVCIVFSRSVVDLPDAVALVRSLRPDNLILVIPVGTNLLFDNVEQITELAVYEAK